MSKILSLKGCYQFEREFSWSIPPNTNEHKYTVVTESDCSFSDFFILFMWLHSALVLRDNEDELLANTSQEIYQHKLLKPRKESCMDWEVICSDNSGFYFLISYNYFLLEQGTEL